jgi:hypothetical protein
MAASQWTKPAPPGAPLGLAGGEVEGDEVGLAPAADVALGCAVGRAEVVLEEGEIEHAESPSAIARTRRRKRTR